MEAAAWPCRQPLRSGFDRIRIGRSTTRLVLIHALVGGGQQGFIGRSVVRKYGCSCARAEPDAFGRGCLNLDPADALLQLESLVFGNLGRTVGDHSNELVARKADAQVVLPQGGPQTGRDLAKRLI